MSESLERDIDANQAEHELYKQHYRTHKASREALIKAYYNENHTIAETTIRFDSVPTYIRKVLGMEPNPESDEEDGPLNLTI